MVLRRLLFTLLNNPQVIEKLSESRLIRRAAQITVYAVTKAQLTSKETAQKILRSDTVQQLQEAAGTSAAKNVQEVSRRVANVRNTFVKQLRTGMREAKNQIKRGK